MRSLFIILFAMSFLPSDAQVYYRRSEFGLAGGLSNYFGDLNPDYGFKSPGYTSSVYYRYNITKYIAFKMAASHAKISYNDKLSTNIFQQTRNLNFQNNVYEMGAFFEFHFFEYNVEDFENRFTPYVTFGLAAFHHDPFTEYDGRKVKLKPLGTEGQKYDEYKDRIYKNNSLAFPFGIGVKYWVNKGLSFHAEVVQRSTFTDYLDDVSTTYVGLDKFVDITPTPYPTPAEILQDRSGEILETPIGIAGQQRGVSTTKDKYMLFQVGLSFRLPTYKCPNDF